MHAKHQVIHRFQTIFKTAVLYILVIHTSTIDYLEAKRATHSHIQVEVFITKSIVPSCIPFRKTVTNHMFIFRSMSKVLIVHQLTIPVFIDPTPFTVYIHYFKTIEITDTFTHLYSVRIGYLTGVFHRTRIKIVVIRLKDATRQTDQFIRVQRECSGSTPFKIFILNRNHSYQHFHTTVSHCTTISHRLIIQVRRGRYSIFVYQTIYITVIIINRAGQTATP